MKFKKGDRVYYVSGVHGDDDYLNPLYKLDKKNIIGTISIIGNGHEWVKVNWDNGVSNSYRETDLKIAKENINKNNHPLTSIFK